MCRLHVRLFAPDCCVSSAAPSRASQNDHATMQQSFTKSMHCTSLTETCWWLRTVFVLVLLQHYRMRDQPAGFHSGVRQPPTRA